MNFDTYLFLGGLIIIIAVSFSKAMYKYGVPTLIIFLLFGMLFGSDGPGGFYFDNYVLAQKIANIALLVIIFSGGFDTSWKSAKKSAKVSVSLASFGVLITAVMVGLFVHLILDFTLLEGFLLGSIISSTDAASVFSILRSRKLNLKNDLVPTLEIESGSNDPMAYMLTILFISLINGNGSNFFLTFILQIIIGLVVGLLVGKLAIVFINKINLEVDGLYIILAISFMLLSYGLSAVLFGNGFLAVYLTGIIMGNNKIVHKVSLVRFFDGLTWLMQIVLFFTLGLLVFPRQVFSVIIPGLLVALFITFIGRPLAVYIIMSIFKKPFKDKILVSWVGFRGAASIVFAIYPLTLGLEKANTIFNIVFFVAIFSVLLQGSLVVPLAKTLKLTEIEGTVLKTFTDYSGDTFTELLEIKIHKDNNFIGRAVKDLDIPTNILIVMIKRNKEIITPKGSTVIELDDVLMLAGNSKEELFEIGKIKRYNQ